MRAEPTDVSDSSQAREAWTIGHSTLSLEELHTRLAGHRIERVADVRRYPASRRHPHVNRETLATCLQARRIGYRWFERLGGRRQGAPERESPNRGLSAGGFRTYADYALGDEFAAGLSELEDWISGTRTAILCAESDWRRCHRRLLADRLVTRGWIVHHVIDATTSEDHRVWDLAGETPRGLVYPPLQSEFDLGT